MNSRAASSIWRQPLSYLVAAAVIAGAYVRFRGLGYAPLAVDEYYLSRSIQNVLHTGIPAWDCGGLYMRGLILQYLAAAVQWLGASAELAPRLICVVSSLLALPAIYIISNRLHGRTIASLALIILSLSVWEIEMARFGRMYAPFQAVFLWYMVYFLRYTTERDPKALRPMILLSIAGPLVWEGGVFLPLVNVLAVLVPRWPATLERRDWMRLAGYAALLALAAWFVTADFRGYTAESWPEGYVRSMSANITDPLTALRLPLSGLLHHPLLLALGVAPLVTLLLALRWTWQYRVRRFTALGLLIILAAALAHQFLVVAGIALLLLLTRLIAWDELFTTAAWPFHATIVLCACFWIAFAAIAGDWHGSEGGGLSRHVAMIGYQLLRFPDVVGVVIRPWGWAIPRLAAALLVLNGIAMYRAARYQVADYERFLLIALLVLLLAAGASRPPRQETRYVFFLYPLLVSVALSVISRGCAAVWQRLAGQSRPAGIAFATCAITLGGFASSEDFQPQHALHIDSPVETFRRNMSYGMQSHLVIRDDDRAIAQWLEAHQGDGHITINGVHGVDQYFPQFTYFFVDQHDSNFPDWSCRRGTVERWSNYPLLTSVSALDAAVSKSSGAYLVAFGYNLDVIMASLAPLHPRVAMSEDNIVILELQE